MFKEPWFQTGTIVSDEGFQVRLRDRYSLQYKEKDLVVDVTSDTVKLQIDLLHDSVSAFRNGQFTRLDPEQDKLVFDRIVEALEWRGYKATVRF